MGSHLVGTCLCCLNSYPYQLNSLELDIKQQQNQTIHESMPISPSYIYTLYIYDQLIIEI